MARTALSELAEYLAGKRREPVKLTGTTGNSGRTDDESRVDGLPMPLGSVGDVLTIVNSGGDIVPSWEAATALSVGRYRDYVLSFDGTEYQHVFDDDMALVYVLAELE